MIQRHFSHTPTHMPTGLGWAFFVTFFLFSLLFGFTMAHAEDKAPVPAAYQLSVKDVEQAVSGALAQYGAGTKLRATVSGAAKPVLYESPHEVQVDIKGLTFDKAATRWSANLLILSNGSVLTAMPLQGRFVEVKPVPVLTRMIKGGDIIAAADVEMLDVPLTSIREGVVTDAAQIVGLTSRGAISVKRPVRLSEVSTPHVVKRGALVQMNYNVGGVAITTSAQAMTAGAKGDVIDVKNVNSKHVVRAVVQDANNVAVEAGASQLTASAGDAHARF